MKTMENQFSLRQIKLIEVNNMDYIVEMRKINEFYVGVIRNHKRFIISRSFSKNKLIRSLKEMILLQLL